MATPFVAEITIYPFNFAPKGWAFASGQLLPLSQNTALFSLLGTQYGGDGKSTFALPNFQGNVPVDGGFRIMSGNAIGFTLGKYDRNRALVIDPTLVYSTYLGGSGDDVGNSVAGG